MIQFVAASLLILSAPADFSPKQIGEVIDSYFSKVPKYKKGDLINQTQVKAVLDQLKKEGWKVKKRDEIISDSLGSGHVMVSTFKSKKGFQFMRKVKGYKNIFDRLDRISKEAGGARLIQDIVKLPDGHRYAVASPRREIPGLLDFLPKNRSGKTRSIKNYEKPTGKIYTQEQLLERLEKEWKAEQKGSK